MKIETTRFCKDKTLDLLQVHPKLLAFVPLAVYSETSLSPRALIGQAHGGQVCVESLVLGLCKQCEQDGPVGTHSSFLSIGRLQILGNIQCQNPKVSCRQQQLVEKLEQSRIFLLESVENHLSKKRKLESGHNYINGEESIMPSKAQYIHTEYLNRIE